MSGTFTGPLFLSPSNSVDNIERLLPSSEPTPTGTPKSFGLLRPTCLASTSPYADRRSLDREVLSIAGPMLATLLADPIAGLVDSAYLGHAGSVQLAGVGVALSIFNTTSRLLCTPLLSVTTSAVASAAGEAHLQEPDHHNHHHSEFSNNSSCISGTNCCCKAGAGAAVRNSVDASGATKAVPRQSSPSTAPIIRATGMGPASIAGSPALRAASACVFLALLGALLQNLALLGSGRWLLALWGVTPRSPVYQPALGFLMVRAVGAPVTILMSTLQGVFRGLQDTRTPFIATLTSNVINIVLAPLLIFWANMGAIGAATATVISQAITLGLLARQLRQGKLRSSLPAPPPSSSSPCPPCSSSCSPQHQQQQPHKHQHQHQQQKTEAFGKAVVVILPVIKPQQQPIVRDRTGRGSTAGHPSCCPVEGTEPSSSGGSCGSLTSSGHWGPGSGPVHHHQQQKQGTHWLLWSLSDLLPLFYPTGWMVLRSAAVMLVYAVATTLTAQAGPAVAASHQICFQVWMAFSLLADALAVAAQTLMARDLGAGSIAGAVQVASRVGELSMCLGLLLAALLALGGSVLPGLFTSDPQVLRIMAAIIPIMAVIQPITVLAMGWDGILYGVGGFRYAAVSMVLAALPCVAVMQLGRLLHVEQEQQLSLGASSVAGVRAAPADAPAMLAAVQAVIQMAGNMQLGLVWAGLTFLMVLRWLAIVVPFIVRRGPFRRLREPAATMSLSAGSVA